MAVKVDIVYEGNLQCTATHGPSGQKITTDAPTDNGGKGEFFSPTDLVGTALGTCVVTLMALAAERSRFDLNLTGTAVRVEKEMTAVPERRIARLNVVIRVPRDLDDKQRAIVEAAARACPVHRSLHPDVIVKMEFHYGAVR
jgi:putative redox protein